MCLLRPWYTGLTASAIAGLLSVKMVVKASVGYPISRSSRRSYTASLVAVHCPIYSTSHDDVATACWRLELHEIGPPPSVKM
jgi:hypothetical protein